MNPNFTIIIVILLNLLLLLFSRMVRTIQKSDADMEVPDTVDEQDKKIRKLWEYRYQNIPNKFFGHGCEHPFSHYLSGHSKVKVDSLDQLCDWLLGFRYIPDRVKKGVRDHWSHPDEFEYERSGDCEDYALWAWRKLKEMRYDAEFTVGKWLHADGRVGTHAWVIVFSANERYLLETTGRSKDRMIKTMELAMTEYIPFAAIDTRLQKKVYMGIIYWLRVLASKR